MPEQPYIQGNGEFGLEVVGESFYREEIAAIAQNRADERAWVYCTATLVPEDTNPHDTEAVGVFIAGSKVGHLSREHARIYRGLTWARNPSSSPALADAVITNGMHIGGKAYSYTVELDLPSSPALASVPIKYPSPIRRNGEPKLKEKDGKWSAVVWLPAHRHELHKHLDCMSWTTESWNTVNVYVLNRQGAGLGFKLIGAPKPFWRSTFGDTEPQISLDLIEPRVGLLSLQRD